MVKKRKIWRFIKHNVNVVVGLTIFCFVVFFAIFGSLFGKDPLQMCLNNILEPPSMQSLFGTDDFGRDLLARVSHGALISVLIGTLVMLNAAFLGTLIGVLAGYFPRAGFLMRIMDAMMAFPTLLLAIGLMAALGSNVINVIIALTIVYTPRMARVVQGVTLSIKDSVFVEAARAVGIGPLRIMFQDIIPNGIAAISVQATFIFAFGVLAEAGLSFVGVGVQPPTATLGNIVGSARSILREAPWLTFIPGMFIFLLVFGVNLFGDGLRVCLDPKERRILEA